MQGPGLVILKSCRGGLRELCFEQWEGGQFFRVSEATVGQGAVWEVGVWMGEEKVLKGRGALFFCGVSFAF